MKFKDEKMQVLFDIILYASYINGYHAGNNESLQIECDKCADNFISYVEQHIDELTTALRGAVVILEFSGNYNRMADEDHALCQRIFKEKKS